MNAAEQLSEPAASALRFFATSCLSYSRKPCNLQSHLEPIARGVGSLASLFTKADRECRIRICENLNSILRAAGDLTGSHLTLKHFFKSAKIDRHSNRKVLRAFDKLVNYWRLCQQLGRIASSRKFQSLIVSVWLDFLGHYAKHKSKRLPLGMCTQKFSLLFSTGNGTLT